MQHRVNPKERRRDDKGVLGFVEDHGPSTIHSLTAHCPSVGASPAGDASVPGRTHHGTYSGPSNRDPRGQGEGERMGPECRREMKCVDRGFSTPETRDTDFPTPDGRSECTSRVQEIGPRYDSHRPHGTGLGHLTSSRAHTRAHVPHRPTYCPSRSGTSGSVPKH